MGKTANCSFRGSAYQFASKNQFCKQKRSSSFTLIFTMLFVSHWSTGLCQTLQGCSDLQGLTNSKTLFPYLKCHLACCAQAGTESGSVRQVRKQVRDTVLLFLSVNKISPMGGAKQKGFWQLCICSLGKGHQLLLPVTPSPLGIFSSFISMDTSLPSNC